MLRPVQVHDAIVISGSSVLGSWMSEMLASACARANPPAEHRTAGRDDPVPDLGRSQGGLRLLTVKRPDRAIMDAIASGTMPVLAVLDDPVDSVRYTKLRHGWDVLDALRELTGTAAAHHLLCGNAAVLVVHRSFSGTAHDLIGHAIDHLGLALEEQHRRALLEDFGGPESDPWRLEAALSRIPDYVRLDQVASAVTAEEATLIRQVLSPLMLGAISEDIGTVTWPSGVFLYGDKPNEVAPPVADVTGGARIIYYGPYFHLPPGQWKVRLIVAFSLEARNTPFLLIVYCNGRALAKVLIRPNDGGAFEGAFTLWHDTPEYNVEIHFMSDEGTIEGHMALGQLTFSRLAMER